ncbi:18609_t:CDS:2, partial [Gigaspora margarita]
MTSYISYKDLSQKITDCALSSKETLDTLSTNYFAKIKADFTPHLEENQIKESVTWSQLGYIARQSWIEDIKLSQQITKKTFQINKENTSYRFETESNKICESNEDNLEQDYINNLEHEDYINSVSSAYDASVLSNYTLLTSSDSIISDEYNDLISDNYIGSAPKSDCEAIEIIQLK